MNTKTLIETWFSIWENGNFEQLPLAEEFAHTSPYGTIEGKESYLAIVGANKDKFLGHKFEIHDLLVDNNKACIRYTAIQNNFKLEVSEWHYIENNLITQIVAYYNIPGPVREDRRIDDYS